MGTLDPGRKEALKHIKNKLDDLINPLQQDNIEVMYGLVESISRQHQGNNLIVKTCRLIKGHLVTCKTIRQKDRNSEDITLVKDEVKVRTEIIRLIDSLLEADDLEGDD